MAALSSLVPTYRGHVASTRDALVLFEACLQGMANHVGRPPREYEQADLIKSGNVFIYEEHSSGISNWADGIQWGPARALGNFVLYQQLAHGVDVERPSSRVGGATEVKNLKLNGDARGLCKRTISVTLGGVSHHLVAYFTLEDAMASHLTVPTNEAQFNSIVPCAELLDQGFLAPVDEDDIKRFVMGMQS